MFDFILDEGFVESFNMIIKSITNKLVDRLLKLLFLIDFLSRSWLEDVVLKSFVLISKIFENKWLFSGVRDFLGLMFGKKARLLLLDLRVNTDVLRNHSGTNHLIIIFFDKNIAPDLLTKSLVITID